MPHHPIVPVLLAGGKGARLWPLSSEEAPKQFITLPGQEKSLFTQTCERLLCLPECHDVIIVTTNAHVDTAREQATAILPASIRLHIIAEPCSRNTAAASLFAALYAEDKWPEEVLWIMPTDHYIPDSPYICSRAEAAAAQAYNTQTITLLGVTPTNTSSHYGYIISQGENVTDFIEKPTTEQLAEITSKPHHWNSGMFISTASILLQESTKYTPELYTALKKLYRQAHQHKDVCLPNAEGYETLPCLPLDKALIEPSNARSLLPLDCIWSDMGSWESLWETAQKDANGNAMIGTKTIITGEGLENLVIVETDDTIFVTKKAG